MTYFLQDVARYLYQKSGGNLRDTLIVFPNRRARLFFNHFVSELAEKPLWAPDYYTISDFIQGISGLKPADPLALLFKLFRAYREVTGSDETFDSFYYYCEMILADFDDIDKYRVPANKLYANLSDLKALEDYREYLSEYQLRTLSEFWETFSSARNSDEKKQFLSVWDLLFSVYERFNRILDDEGISYEGKAYRKAIDRLMEGVEYNEKGRYIAFVGFNALNRTEEILFEVLKKQGRVQFFWDTDPAYIDQDYHEAGYFLRNYLKRFPQPDDFKAGQTPGHSECKITTLAVPSNISQAKVIDQCLDMIGSGEISSPLQTALILADESLLIPVVNSIPSGIKKINISMGYPLRDTPAYSLITLLAELRKNVRVKKPGNSERSFLGRDFFNLFRHEFLQDISHSDEFARFEKQCIERNRVYINITDIQLTDPVSKAILRISCSSADFAGYLREVTGEVADLLLSNREPGKQIQWQLEILYSMHKVLMRCESLLSESGIEMDLATAMNLIRKIIGGMSVPFSGEPLHGLQVLGILETRTLDFRNLIILSMNEGHFPKSGHAPSFIPFSLREAFGLPTLRHQDAIFSYYFYRLLHRAENIVLVYNTRTEGLQKGEPSRFIQQLRYEMPVPPQHIVMGYKIDPFPRKSITARKDKEALEILNRYCQPEDDNFLSASAVNMYLNCKLSFFFRYIGKIKEPATISESIEADVFGSILHKAMKLLYSDFGSKIVNAEDIRKLRNDREQIAHYIDQAFNEEYFKVPSGISAEYKGRNLIIRQVMNTYVGNILAFDEKNVPFRIDTLEEKYTWPLELSGGKRKVWIGGIIDRIDFKNEVCRIIDYKTGKVGSEFKDPEETFSSDAGHSCDAIRQSFLYSLVVSKLKNYKKIQPSLFFVRSILQEDFDPRIINRSSGRIPVEDFSTLSADIENRLVEILSELYDPDVEFVQTEDENRCTYCLYRSICWRGPE